MICGPWDVGSTPSVSIWKVGSSIAELRIAVPLPSLSSGVQRGRHGAQAAEANVIDGGWRPVPGASVDDELAARQGPGVTSGSSRRHRSRRPACRCDLGLQDVAVVQAVAPGCTPERAIARSPGRCG